MVFVAAGVVACEDIPRFDISSGAEKSPALCISQTFGTEAKIVENHIPGQKHPIHRLLSHGVREPELLGLGIFPSGPSMRQPLL